MSNEIKLFSDSTIEGINVDDKLGVITVKGYANRYMDGLGDKIVDRDNEIVEINNFDFSSFMKNPVMLYMHDHNNIIGKVKSLEHRADGLVIEAEVHRVPGAENVYESVKRGLLQTFSIGFRATEYEYDEDLDAVVIKKGELWEVSIVSIPANADSIFSVVDIKSAEGEGTCKGLACSVDIIKKQNPDACCKGYKRIKMLDGIKESIEKALTIEETEMESWNQKRRVDYQMSLLFEVLDDNFWEERWGDIEKPDMLSNIKDAFTEVQNRINVILSEEDVEKSVKGANMEKVVKSATEGEEAPETKEEVAAEEVVEDKPAEAPAEVKEEEVPEAKEEVKEEEPKEEVPVEEPTPEVEEEKPEAKKEEEPEVKEDSSISLQDALAVVAGIDTESLSDEDLEKVYEVLASKTETIESSIATQVVESMTQPN